MMRLPLFAYHAPRTIGEAAQILADEGPDAALLAGGTDLLPNMKRRQQTPRTLVALRRIGELRGARWNGDGSAGSAGGNAGRGAGSSGVAIGASTTLTEIVRDARLRAEAPALWQAAAQIATPQLRSMGTLGGNLCLDTRCNYYDQNYEWRKAIDFCMKKDGEICWVATGSPKCLAVSSTDSAPALMALGARVRLVSRAGEREIALDDLYRNDGIAYMTRRPDEILTEIEIGSQVGWRSTYWKLRRRGAFDFPVLSVAAAARCDAVGVVQEARIVLGSVASRPMLALDAASALIGRPLDDDALHEAAGLASQVAKPMDNTDFALGWRKRVARDLVLQALREIRGDDQRRARERLVRHALLSVS
jgi:4-hydroxybenzoyl-CoA reductase subunit beta